MSNLIPHSAAMPAVYLAAKLDNGRIEFEMPGVIGWRYKDSGYFPKLTANIYRENEPMVFGMPTGLLSEQNVLPFLILSFKRKDGSSTDPKFFRTLSDVATFIMVDGRKD